MKMTFGAGGEIPHRPGGPLRMSLRDTEDLSACFARMTYKTNSLCPED